MKHPTLLIWRAIGAPCAVPFEFLGSDGVWRLLYIDENAAPVVVL